MSSRRDSRDIGCVAFREIKSPLRLVQINVLPFGCAQFARSHEYHWGDAKCIWDHERAFVHIDCPQDVANFFRRCYRRKMLLFHRLQSSAQIVCDALPASASGNAVSKHLPTASKGSMAVFFTSWFSIFRIISKNSVGVISAMGRLPKYGKISFSNRA